MAPRLKAAPPPLSRQRCTESVDAAAKGRGQDDAHEQDETDVALTRQGIEGDDRNQIGQPQFRPWRDEGHGQHPFDDV